MRLFVLVMHSIEDDTTILGIFESPERAYQWAHENHKVTVEAWHDDLYGEKNVWVEDASSLKKNDSVPYYTFYLEETKVTE